VAGRHLEFCHALATRLNTASIRTDLDDREESMNKKVRAAGMDWVPYVIVVGDREVETGNLTVTVRKLSAPEKPHKAQMREADLVRAVREETGQLPFRPLYTPVLLSQKPRFI
jgi:threonyl-tRNA synthetase